MALEDWAVGKPGGRFHLLACFLILLHILLILKVRPDLIFQYYQMDAISDKLIKNSGAAPVSELFPFIVSYY